MVRQSNFSSVHPSTGAIALTPTHYDKRALTCTDPLALSHSLLNLTYLTCTHARIAQVLAVDGGLECLVRIVLKGVQKVCVAKGARAQQWGVCIVAGVCCLSNVAVRGNQRLRRRLVEAKVIPVLIVVLSGAFAAGSGKGPALKTTADGQDVLSPLAAAAMAVESQDGSPNINTTYPQSLQPELSATTADSLPPDTTNGTLLGLPSPNLSSTTDIETTTTTTTTTSSITTPLIPASTHPTLLPALKLTAYLSKYASLRAHLHGSTPNIFALTEHFTGPQYNPEIRRWAIICMRNAFKRADGCQPFRRCGNFGPEKRFEDACGRVEKIEREFLKCSRCRRVVYCRYV
ncbi:hypothetical protein SpCBS45565_g01984 [Spizellomyces sp. 'palustris']|nr:hypothetical protein SpCBS45565_g01984 [Spizellomyces sp. 'palustris']